MSYKPYKDDGSTVGGVAWVVACIACLIVGYTVRHLGFIVQLNQTVQQEQR